MLAPNSVHRSIVVVDVAGFGDPRRTNPQQVTVRAGVYQALLGAFDAADVPWVDCDHEDRGDGVLVLVRPEVPKCRLTEALPGALALALGKHNEAHSASEKIRLRMALHAGEVTYDDHGVTGVSINLAFRLIEAMPFKAALAASPGALGVIVSSWFFDEVVVHSPASDPNHYRRVRVAIKETVTTGWIRLLDDPRTPGRPAIPPPSAIRTPRVVPAQLPLDVYGFAGRGEQLAELDTLLDTATGNRPTSVVISAVSGTVGVGKTALAVHWAHRARDHFPDGQLYVNLRGFDQGRQVVAPAEAVRYFLDALGVPPRRIPPGLDAQAALFRGLLDGRRMLVVLDNARDADQVRPLLPGSPTAMVLITSRNQLTGLVAVDGAHPLSLDLLSPTEARELLGRRLGTGRVAAEPTAVEEIIKWCAALPLALTIVAARVAQSGFSLATLATELAETGGRLDALNAGDAASELRAVFSWSYTALTDHAAQLFRLLGLHPGPDISAPTAASLTGSEPGPTRRALSELARASLLVERRPGRFTMHDLLRVYAADLTHVHDTDDQLRAAQIRLINHYLHTSYTADRVIHPARDPIAMDLFPPEPGITPETPVDHDRAMRWLAIEHPVVLAIARQAAEVGLDTQAWQLAWSLDTFLNRRGHWHDLTLIWQTGLDAAGRLDRSTAQAYAHHSLAKARCRLGQPQQAYIHQRRALDLYNLSGDQAGRAVAHYDLADLLGHNGRPDAAFFHAQQAFTLYQETDHGRGQALVLNQIGWLHALLGNHHEAILSCRRALSLFQHLHDQDGEGEAWNSLGYAHHHLGRQNEAETCCSRALDLCRNLGDRYKEAATLTRLGDIHHATNHSGAAHDAWQDALAILTELHHPDAIAVQTKLNAAESARGRRPTAG